MEQVIEMNECLKGKVSVVRGGKSPKIEFTVSCMISNPDDVQRVSRNIIRLLEELESKVAGGEIKYE